MGSEDLPEAIDEIGLVLTDDDEIHALNRDFRGKDKPTDVLSFSQLEGEELAGGTFLGDVVISIDTAERQARARKLTLEEELLRLMIHGTLHLFGYDHENVPPSEAARMRRRERKLMAAHLDDASAFFVKRRAKRPVKARAARGKLRSSSARAS